MDQPGKVPDPVWGQLNRETYFFPEPARAREFGLVPSRVSLLLIFHAQVESDAYLYFLPLPASMRKSNVTLLGL